ncbi:MAG: TolC family protein, partial [Acidobacteriota bacterium]
VAADAYPQVALVGGWSQARNPALLNSPDFEDFVDQIPGGFEPRSQETWDAAIEVTQPVYSGGKVRASIELAEVVAAIADAQIDDSQLDTALATAEAFYQLLAAERSLDVVAAQQRARQASLDVVEARYELGDATELERLRGRSALAEVAPELARAEGEVEVARSRLASLLALDPTTSIGVVSSVDKLPEMVSHTELDKTVERPDLIDLALQIDALEQESVVTRAEQRPQVDFELLYGRQARLIEDIEDPLFDNWRVALTVRWEFFDGGRRRAELAQLDSRREQATWRLRAREDAVALEIAEARTDYRAARATAEAADLAAEVAREASRVAAESFQLGVALQADLLDAQEQEIQADLSAVRAYYDALIASTRLSRALGKLPTEPWWEENHP